MINNTSENNVEVIKEIVGNRLLSKVFLVDRADNIPGFLSAFTVMSPATKEFFVFTKDRPVLLLEDSRWKARVEERPWSLKELYRFVFGKAPSPVITTGDEALYERDVARLSVWRWRYAMGPFTRFSVWIDQRSKNRFLRGLGYFVLSIPGLILQSFLPPFRKTKGVVHLEHGDIKASIYYDGGPDKDHYGESPTVEDEIELFSRTIEQANEGNDSDSMGFFFALGPRHKFIEKVLDIEDGKLIGPFTIFARGLYRKATFEVTDRRPRGCFFKGSNVTPDKRIIYSEHCLSIGAGEKELWCYESAGNADD